MSARVDSLGMPASENLHNVTGAINKYPLAQADAREAAYSFSPRRAPVAVPITYRRLS
jgi:hypothetical protein